jgi:membrane protein required for colicin V production
MNGLDWVLAGIAVFSLARGMWRGAVSQVFGILGVIGGFVLASNYYQVLAVRVTQAFPSLTAPQAVSFAVLFLLTWFCIGLLGYLIGKLLHGTGLGFLDRVAGGAVGVAKAAVIAVVLISALTFFLPPQSPLLSESCLVPHVQEIGRFLVRVTPESVQTLFEEKQKELKRYWLERDRGDKKSDTGAKKDKKEPRIKYDGAQVTGNILSGYQIVIPACFWRESRPAQ